VVLAVVALVLSGVVQLPHKQAQVAATARHLQFLVLLLHTLAEVAARQMGLLHRLVLEELAEVALEEQQRKEMETQHLEPQTQAVAVADIQLHKPLLFLEILVLVALAL
jgi:hypothetical protein